ncbi:hypothetical protein RR48_07876 [Papilio machaon]|uniref:Uncharacterized protein n=1 Tax=Papilio machaon TaxID=76193 RepID=A0A194QYZ3_PAPMA|nr:hypothetical protein RR48_07876 [Papilio machaon]
MDSNRRNRRKKCRFGVTTELNGLETSHTSNSSYLGHICTYLILSSLIVIVFLLMEYNCTTCKAKCDLNCISKNVENISSHLSFMKDNYKKLENQVLKLSREFPKFEGQLEVLETLANTLDATENGWDPKTQEPLPYVGVSLEYSRKPFRGLNKSTQNPYAMDVNVV